jgi:hypothetical protein
MMDTTTLGKIMAFLASIPPRSHLRLMFQLALAVEVPQAQRDQLLLPLREDKDLGELILNENLLSRLIEADGILEEAEKNMLGEVMDQVGLVVPLSLEMKDEVIEQLSHNLFEEIAEVKSSGSVQGIPLIW